MNNHSSFQHHEKNRLLTLKNYQILDTATEQVFDEITELAADICDAPIASISFVDADRLWFKSITGVSASEAPRVNSFCGQAILQDELFVVKDASQDLRFSQNILVTSDAGIRFYAGQPLQTPDGFNLGTLCVLDTKPRDLNQKQSKALQYLSNQITLQLQHRFDLIKLDHMGEVLDRTGSLAKVGGWELDLTTNQLSWTKEVFAIHELAEGDIPSLEEAISFYYPQDQIKIKSAIEQAISHNMGWDLELPFITAKNREIWVRAQGQALSENGRVTRLAGAFQDITEKKKNEIKLRWVNRALQLLRHCNQSLLQVKDEQQLIQNICQLIVEEGGYSFAWVGAIDAEVDQQIHPLGFCGNGEKYLTDNELCFAPDTKMGKGPCGFAIRSGKMVRNDDIQASTSEHTELLRSYGYSSIVSLPLKNDLDQVIGLLAIYSDQEHQHSEEELNLLSNLAQNLAAGVVKIRKEIEHRRISLAISKLAKALSAVTNDSFFEELVFSMADTLNADAGYVARLLYSPKLKLQTLSVIVDGKIEPNFEYAITDALKNSLFQNDSVRLVRSGAYSHPIYKNLSLMRHYPYEGFAGFRLSNSKEVDFGLIFVFFKDKVSESQEQLIRSTISIFASRTTSELERIEDALLIQERAALIDKSHDPMVVRDLEHKITYWNHAAERMYGWTESEAIGCKVDELLKIEPLMFLEGNKQTVEHSEWYGDCVEHHKDGRAMVVEIHSTLVRDKFGEPRSIFSIKNDITGKKIEENEIRRFAYYDALTQLPNRRLLIDKLVSTVNALKNTDTTAALLYLDLDKFKSVNDTYGHDEGDLLLQLVSERLKAVTRKRDTVARLGGDEFVILINDLGERNTTLKTIEKIASKVIKSFEEPFNLKSTLFKTSTSIGIKVFDQTLSSWEEALKHADEVMYISKEKGRNQYSFF